MGIPRLLTYCLKPENGCIEKIDLVQIAQQRNGIELLVDLKNFLGNMWLHFKESLCLATGNKLIGGEYVTFHHFVCNLLKKLKSIGITLRFYNDGCHGSCSEQTKQKFNTWKKRKLQHVDRVNRLLNVCREAENVEHFEDCIAPVCLEIQFIQSIESCDLDIVQIPSGEADHIIAADLEKREKAFAVLSSDSDFCIFRNCRFIPYKNFDMDNDLLLDSIHEPFHTIPPKKIMCGMITNEQVVTSLSFSSQSDLIEMSILVGNDFTMEYLNGGLHSKIGCTKIEEYADVIRRYKRVESIPEFIKELKGKPTFQEAIIYSRDFYLLRITDQPLGDDDFFTGMIKRKIMELKYPPHILGMHKNCYWHMNVLEDTTHGAPCAEIAVKTLRCIIYRMIQQEDYVKTVKEYGRTPYQKFDCKEVQAINDVHIPKIDSIQLNQKWRNLRHFHYIMTHLESEEIESLWTEKYGRKNGFRYLLLRYFLLLNWKKNLHVTENEFLGLVALVFGNHNEEKEYQKVPICPSPRCVTLGSWLEVIYRTMFLFLSKLLFLSSEFPLPHELFSSSVWNVFFVCSNRHAWQRENGRHGGFLHQANTYMKSVIREKSNIIYDLTEGCFSFDERLLKTPQDEFSSCYVAASS